MTTGTKDKVEGKINEAVGAIKEVAGKVIDSPALTGEGIAQKVAGKVETKAGEVKQVLGK